MASTSDALGVTNLSGQCANLALDDDGVGISFVPDSEIPANNVGEADTWDIIGRFLMDKVIR